ncbi:hypothetical protein [Parasitella parasitica]|uniref:Uncharacterized protein n=1 Tax=Parasitella parasitica TaxID=35722 RepID=A0A0B7NQJ5_9FUNG|nr:hypothetical protein [Parasitella parasitica]
MSKKTSRRNLASNNKPEEPRPIPTSNPNDVLESEVQVPDNSIIGADEANKKPLEFSFFNRVLSIPIIRDSSSMVQHYANQNSISRFALNKAESTIKLAASIALPYAEKYKPHLLKADQMGCQSLDLVETRFPVVTQPPREILTSVKESPHKVYQDVKGKITYAASIPVTRTTQGLQQLVDKYLPAADSAANSDQKQQQQTKDKGAANGNHGEVKLLSLANEVKDRLTHRVATQWQSIPHTKADISRLAETNRLLHEAFQSIQKANTRLHEFVLSVKGYKDTTQTKANQRINELTADLIHRLDAAAAYVKDRQVINSLPSSLHVVVDPLVTFASNEYEIVRTEVLKPDLAPFQKATNILHMTQGYVLPLIQKSIHGVEDQVRQYGAYANNSKVVRDVKSTFGFVDVEA